VISSINSAKADDASRGAFFSREIFLMTRATCPTVCFAEFQRVLLLRILRSYCSRTDKAAPRSASLRCHGELRSGHHSDLFKV
jgi:hypothetical protein